MDAQSNHDSTLAGSTPVPDLIERYRLRRDAWIAQADELARLRDEVRGSAEREAMEIVTTARREVRKVLTEARRELLVLSAQVQAALGEVNAKTDPATLLHKAGIALGEGDDAALPPGSTEAFAPEAVDEIMDEVHGDMAALDEDARALPLQAVPPLQSVPAHPPAVPEAPVETVSPQPGPVDEPPRAYPSLAAPREDVRIEVPPGVAAEKLQRTYNAMLSPFPSEAVPVQPVGRLRTFVSVFVGVGIVVVLGTMWWLGRGDRPRGADLESAGAAPADASSPAVPAPADKVVETSPVVPVPTTSGKPGGLTLAVEAIREVWVRATVDGQADLGRTMSTGQVLNLSADQSIALRVGDAGALVVSVNRGDKRPLGRDGQVMTRQFLVEGSASPTPVSAPPSAPAPEAPTRGPFGPPTASATPQFPPSSAPTPAPAVASTAASPISPAPVGTLANPFPRVENTVATPLPAPTSSAPVPATPTAAPTTAAASNAPASPATAVVAAARQWLDAYHRQDRAAMAALSTDNLLLADERRTDERLPPGLTDVTRTLDRVSVQIAADTAVLTAVMTEQSSSMPTPRVSPVSQVWVLAGGGQWKVRQARFVSEARLNQVFR